LFIIFGGTDTLVNKYFKKKIRVSVMPIIGTTRLSLCPFSSRDAQRVQLLAGDEAIASGAINMPHPYTDGLAESWISTHEDEYQKGNSLILAITLSESGLLIGSIGLYINRKHQNAELGYWIGREYWGNGYCTEAVNAFVDYAFMKLKLNKVYAHYISRNDASGKVLQKNGFMTEGLLKKHVRYKDTYQDIICAGLLRSDYIQNKKEPL
jgi:[ribosomal protein S5]-alanine N-acetyltransferase